MGVTADNCIVALLDRTEATGRYPSYRGWCLCHPDKESGGHRSLSIDFKAKDPGMPGYVKAYIFCSSCGANGVQTFRKLERIFDFGHLESFVEANQRRARRPPPPLPTPEALARASTALLADDWWLDDLMERGIAREVIERYMVGLQPKYQHLFPVIEDGRVVNCQRRALAPDDEGRRKVTNWPGVKREAATLYPGKPTTDWVLLTEGELDALVALSHGVPAVSGTLGARTWMPHWTPAFAGRTVVIAYDCDDAGRTGARAVMCALLGTARQVWRIDLDPRRDDGYDLTDFFKDGHTTDDLKAIIRATKRREPRPKPRPSPSSVVATSRRQKAGR